MYTSLRDIMSLVHYAFILVQRLMSAEQENGVRRRRKPFRLSTVSLQQLFKYTLTSLNSHIHTRARKTLNQLKSAPFQIGTAVRL